MKIYTKTGDQGQTSLLGGKRLPKNHLRIEAYGTVDELNSFLGLVRDQMNEDEIKKLIIDIQDRLFTIGSILAAAGETEKFKIPQISESDIEILEKEMDRMDKELQPMRTFVLPGGHVIVSHTHICRTVCRRAERRCVELMQSEQVPELIVKYLNRLSDYFFVLSRYMTLKTGAEEIPWKPKL